MDNDGMKLNFFVSAQAFTRIAKAINTFALLD